MKKALNCSVMIKVGLCCSCLTAVALEVLLSRGGLKFVLPYQGEAPQTPLFHIATNVVRTIPFTSVKVT